MAKRKTSTRTITRVVKAPAPVIRVSAPRAPAKTKRRRSSSSSGGGKKGLQKTMFGVAAGGFVTGYVEKTFPTLPTLPIIGRKGTIAVIGYMLSDKGGTIGGIARDVAVAASALAGYEFGKEGRVTGDYDGPVPQVSGVAAQV